MANPQKPIRDLNKSPDKKIYRPLFLDRSGDLRPSVERELNNISLAFIDLVSSLENEWSNFPKDPATGKRIYPTGGGGGGTAGVTSFKGRTGAVVPVNGDYSIGQITGSNLLVQLSSNNVFTGTNQFNVIPTVLGTLPDPTLANQLVTKKYVDTQVSGIAKVNTANTFTLVNTFNVPPVSPTAPTSNTQLVNKLYVDTKVSQGGGIVNGDVSVALNFLGKVEWWNGSKDESKLPDGYLPADGRTLNRVDYPELWDLIANGTLESVSEADWQNGTPVPHDPLTNAQNRGKYSTGDGSTTFRLPDLIGKQTGSWGHLFLSSLSSTSVNKNGTILPSSAPDIQGQFTTTVDGQFHLPTGSFSNAFSSLNTDGNVLATIAANQYTLGTHTRGAKFAASGSNGVYGRFGNTTEITPNTAYGMWLVRVSNQNTVNGIIPTKRYVDSLFSQNVGTSGGFVGNVTWGNMKDGYVPDGYVAADGQELIRVDHPELWEAVKNGLFALCGDATGTILGRDSDWLATPTARGSYSYGDGDKNTGTTFRVPDLNGKHAGSIPALFLRGDGAIPGESNNHPGVVRESAAPDITGSFTTPWSASKGSLIEAQTGAFTATGASVSTIPNISSLANSAVTSPRNIITTFTASNGDGTTGVYGRNSTTEVRPNSVRGVWLIQTKQLTMTVNAGGFDHIDVGSNPLPITAKSVELKGDLNVDGAASFTGVVKGITPVADTDLTTKEYVDDSVKAAEAYADKLNKWIPHTDPLFAEYFSLPAGATMATGETFMKMGVNSIELRGNIHLNPALTTVDATILTLKKHPPGFTTLSKPYGRIMISNWHVVNNTIPQILTQIIPSTTTFPAPIKMFGGIVNYTGTANVVFDELFVFS